MGFSDQCSVCHQFNDMVDIKYVQGDYYCEECYSEEYSDREVYDSFDNIPCNCNCCDHSN